VTDPPVPAGERREEQLVLRQIAQYAMLAQSDPDAQADGPEATLDDWRIIRERNWDWHDQHLVVRPFVDALFAQLNALRAALHAQEGPRDE